MGVSPIAVTQHVILHDIQGEGTIPLYDVLWNHADKKRKAGELIEDLKPKNMVKNHKLASAILDANFGRMSQFL